MLTLNEYISSDHQFDKFFEKIFKNIEEKREYGEDSSPVVKMKQKGKTFFSYNVIEKTEIL